MNPPIRKPKVLVFEPDAQGHRLNYAKTVIDAIHPLVANVIFCTQEATIASREYAIHFSQLPENTSVELFRSRSFHSLLRSQIYFARMYLAAIKRLQPDYVYVPTADGLIQLIGWLSLLTAKRRRTFHAEMLVMGGHSYLESNSSLKKQLKRWWAVSGINMSGCAKLHALDEQLYSMLSRCNLGVIQLDLMPENRTIQQIPDKQRSRKEFGLEPNDLVIGFFGRRSIRKGFDLLLNAFAGLEIPEVKLLILGQDDASTTALYNSSVQNELRHRIISRNAYVSSEELLLGMTAADVVCIPYPKHHGSSGFLVDAAATGNMLLTTDFGWIGENVKRYELGTTCDVLSPSIFRSALKQAVLDCKSFQHSTLSTSFLNLNSRETVKAKWAAAISAHLGKL